MYSKKVPFFIFFYSEKIELLWGMSYWFSRVLGFVVVASLLTSCYVQHPRYSKMDQVLLLNPGQTMDTVSKILGTKPYDLVSKKDSGETVYLYKYRREEVKRIPVFMRRNKGIPAEGEFRDLYITFDIDGKVVEIETREEGRETVVDKKKIDPNSILQAVTTIITVTLPAVMVFLSLGR
jgi:hypothetical protein